MMLAMERQTHYYEEQMKLAGKRQRPSCSSSPLSILAFCLGISLIIFLLHTCAMIELEWSSIHKQNGRFMEAISIRNQQQLQQQQQVVRCNNNNNNNNLVSSSSSSDDDDYENRMVLSYNDSIYKGKLDVSWDMAPIVMESHKLVFFTIPKVGCTVWKQLFRRMMGYRNWRDQNGVSLIPHNPSQNGLKYLYHYSLEKANHMLTSPNYTRAIFVRDPKERFLSAFLDKALSNDGRHIARKCCRSKQKGGGGTTGSTTRRNNETMLQEQEEEDKRISQCIKDGQTFRGFLKLVKHCYDDHWGSQTSRIVEKKYWKYINFVGHIENGQEDSKRLLQKIGAWDRFGKSGWGKYGNQSIFEPSADAGIHATHAKWKVWQWYTPQLEHLVENYYSADYSNPIFNFTKIQFTA